MLQEWWKNLHRWMRRLLKQKAAPRKATILSSEYAADKKGSCHLLLRESPGAIGTWRIVRADGGRDLLITCDNILSLRKAVERSRRSDDLGIRDGSLAATINDTLLGKAFLRDPSCTHRFGFAWVERYTTHGQVRFQILQVWDGHFVSSRESQNLREDKTAFSIGFAIAKACMRLRTIPEKSWAERIEEINWGDWLSDYGRQHLGKSHRLNLLRRK